VTAQLVRVEDGATLWADTLDEPFTDLFQVQDALSARLAGALAVKLGGGPSGAVRRSADADAYRAYLRGRYFWNRLTAPWLDRALVEFRAAVARDPGFAPAWAGLADTLSMLTLFGTTPAREGWPLAREAAERAVALDPGLAEAHVSLGYVRLFQDWDWKGAERASLQAIALDRVRVSLDEVRGADGVPALAERVLAGELDPYRAAAELTGRMGLD